MVKVREIMREASITLRKDDTVAKALSIMASEGLWVIPIVSGEGRLVGVVSYRELLERRVSPRARVSSVMYPPYSVNGDDDFSEAVGRIFTLRVRGIPVVDSDRYLIGIIMREDVIRYLLNANMLPGGRVSSIMSSPAITIDAEESVARARMVMLKNGVSKLPVIEGGKLYGIVSMRDLAEKMYYAFYQIGSRRTGFYKTEEEILAAPVKEVASSPAVTVDQNDPVRRVAELILSKRYSGFPVLSEGRIVGMVSSYDIVKSVVRVREELPVEARISDLEAEDQRQALNRLISSYIAKISRITKILDIKVIVKRLSKAGSGGAYIVNVYVKTNHDQYSVEEIDKDPLIAARRSLDLIEKRIIKHYDRLRTLKRREKQEVE
ncbi:MAG TPA: CBS domain-containing protein [Sulfolobales archaeon]|nr:CBS domain-containing protein [Sulfolobales archaeon]